MANDQLQAYYRRIGTYVSLPSGSDYYTDSVISLTDSGEVGIIAMTSADEMNMKNPDMLLNGESILKTLKSCVDGLSKPEMLLASDVNVLLFAIKQESYKTHDQYTSTCVECGDENSFTIDSARMIAEAEEIRNDYHVVLPEGLTIWIRPYTMADNIKALSSNFETSKLQRALIEAGDDEAKAMKLFNKAMKTITEITAKLMVGCIHRMTDEDNGVDIECDSTTLADTAALLKNLPTESAVMIDDKIKEINNIGMDTNVTIKCSGEECNHEWSANVDVNPVNFSTAS